MIDLPLRSAIARRLIDDHDRVAASVTEAFYRRHPEWEARYGVHGRRRCMEDTRLHLASLAGAVQAGSPSAFADYAAWCGDMLAARSIDRAHLVEHLELIEEHLDVPAEGRGLIAEMLDAGRVVLATPVALTVAAEASPHVLQPTRDSYLAAILAGDRRGAWRVIEGALGAQTPLRDLYVEVVIWSQRQLGELWARSQISVAQEHMASSVAQGVVSRLYMEQRQPRTRGRVLLAGVEGELHVLPAQLACDLLELDGWDVAFVGTNAPEGSIRAAIAAERPSVVGLSVTMVSHLPSTVALAKAIRREHPELPVVVGGRAVRSAERLAAELNIAIDVSSDLAAFRALGS